jgi:succinoglycan biosynthesis protein ExoA
VTSTGHVGAEAELAPFPTLSVIVPARNERRRLPALIADIERQSLGPTEVLVVDGMSDDGTRAWAEGAAKTRPWLRVLDNPDRLIPAALNRGLAVARGDLVARMDTHVYYGPDYLAGLVEGMLQHPEAAGVGGVLRTVGDGTWAGPIASVLRQPWALGGAPHRSERSSRPVDHTTCPLYRREAALRLGGWDTRLRASEDVEFDHRLTTTMGPLWLLPATHSIWYARDSPRALARQMVRYGYFRARCAHLHPATVRLRHLAPLVVVAGLPLAAGANRRRGGAAVIAYLATALLLGAWSGRKDNVSRLRAAVVVPIIHVSWGLGLLAGLIRHVGAHPSLDPALGQRQLESSLLGDAETATAGRPRP